MRKLFCSLALLSAILAFSQTVTLDWNGFEESSPTFGTSTKIPRAAGFQTQATNGGIFIVYESKLKNPKVVNPQWELVPAESLFDLSGGDLPVQEIFEKEIFDEKENKSRLLISTFKREGNQVYRLKAFSVENDNSPVQAVSSRLNKLLAGGGPISNPLASGDFYKIKVDKTGVFKITYQFLRDNGINPAQINPTNFRVYGNGGIMLPEYSTDFRYEGLQENAIELVGMQDGSWDSGDYALFYAQGPDAFNNYKGGFGTSDNKRTETRTDASLHLKNIYEDAAYYFINFDKGQGKRVQSQSIPLPSTLIDTYDAYQVIDEEKNNLMKTGRIWVGDLISGTRSVTFDLNSSLQSGDQVTVNARVVGFNSASTSILTKVNGANDQNFQTSSSGAGYNLVYYKKNLTNLTGNKITVDFTPNTGGNPSAGYYFDYVEVLYPQKLQFNGSQMNFRKYTLSGATTYGFKLSNSNNSTKVWNVSDLTNAVAVSNQGSSSDYTFGYQNGGSFNNEFVAFQDSAAYTPAFVGKIANQDLSSLTADYLIITQDNMLGEAQRLADFHTQRHNYETAVVTAAQIYNEFSSGGQDITAIRDFVTHLKNTGSLKYILILGDTSYDFKDRISGNTNIVPAFQSELSSGYSSSYVTDDYFGMTGTQVSATLIWRTLPEIPVGRLPAATVGEAKALVDKTLAYNNALPGQANPFGAWRMNLGFIADQDDSRTFDRPFYETMEQTLHPAGSQAPVGLDELKPYHIDKMYLAAEQPTSTAGGNRFPSIENGITNFIDNGLFLYYLGHGGVNGWSQARILPTTSIQNMNNFSRAFARFPLISTITCEFTLWDDPQLVSAGEMMMKSITGGPATMITSSRELLISYGLNFTRRYIQDILELGSDGQFEALGDAFLKAKNQFGADSNHLKVNYLGDPAMRLARPQEFITNVKIKNKESAETSDIQNFQAKALDFITISGNVTSDGSNLDADYNGRVTVLIYDKLVKKDIIAVPSGITTKDFMVEGNPILRTTGTVKNGEFTIQFYIPKDINFDLGDGRLLLYAENWNQANDNSYDVFYQSKIMVGDINPNGIQDDTPPQIQLYMNNTNFADGGITDANPTLLACITDDSGINTSGSGIGHDLTAVLDGKVVETYVLNNFYTSGEGNGCVALNFEDYQKGSMSFPFSNLEPGEHQVTVKVWDINNNSATQTLNFIVEDESERKLTINRLLNWPNPFTDKTYVQFEHNCDDVLDVNVQIYTITGKLVRTLRTTVSAEPFREGYRTPRTAIEWDGLDDFGDAVGKGTYIFKVLVKAQNNEKCLGSATGVEKMMLLK